LQSEDMMPKHLPQTAFDVFRFSLWEKFVYLIPLKFLWLFEFFPFFVNASGDLEKMKYMDKLYWLYKTRSPIVKIPDCQKKRVELLLKEGGQFSQRIPADFTVQSKLTIKSAGDLINHQFLLKSGNVLYHDVKELLFDADLKMANLECVVISRNSKREFTTKSGPLLSYSPDLFKIVKGHENVNFDYLSAACNHSLDFGIDGVIDTATHLKLQNILFGGIYPDESNPLGFEIINKNNIKLGIICYTFGLNGNKPPGNKSNIVNFLNLNDPVEKINFSIIKKKIHTLKSKHVDFIMMHLHWGMEHEFYPTINQINVAHYLCEMGVDAIIGHHPHVIQPVEYYTTSRDPERVAPIFYSLGNLINPFSHEFLRVSFIAEIVLTKLVREDNGERKTYVTKVMASPVIQNIDSVNGQISLRKLTDIGKQVPFFKQIEFL